jgi:hypothetical protein
VAGVDRFQGPVKVGHRDWLGGDILNTAEARDVLEIDGTDGAVAVSGDVYLDALCVGVMVLSVDF